ncbi:hypothetical protein CLOM_g22279 [Closterium sp. NIES-68]|nr:hypothetical protein CLOM_g22279 [Closterium sp. NIES-68]GJP64451.1 hypothetical protein CLOP_g21440 [Closterium sp. NIES-67]
MVSLEAAHAMQEALLKKFAELGVAYQLYTHPPVLTVDEQAAQVKGATGEFTKNLLLKDKKGRLILISALTKTKIDLKLLSQRLGLGKGGLRMAPDENLATVLQVPAGCVTPLALFSDSAKDVVLLLDHGFTSQPHLLFHPLSNDATVALTREAFEAFLRSVGRSEPAYVDLEANVVVGKDQPPDLAAHLPAPSTAAAAADGTSAVTTAATSSSSGTSAGPSTSTSGPKAGAAGAAGKGKTAPQKKTPAAVPKGPPGDDVATCTTRILEMLTEHMKKCNGNSTVADQTASGSSTTEDLALNLQHALVMFKNAAYTNGFFAGRSAVLDRVQGS